MGFYSNWIVPWGLEWAMSDPTSTQYRQAILADVYGEVLEIGVGTGVNYPSLTANGIAWASNFTGNSI